VPTELPRTPPPIEPQPTEKNNQTSSNIEPPSPINPEPTPAPPSEHSEAEDNNNPETPAPPKNNNPSDTDSDEKKNMKIPQPSKLKEDTIPQNAEHIENWIETIKNYFKLATVDEEDQVGYIKLW
jgi:hypothetical protein